METIPSRWRYKNHATWQVRNVTNENLDCWNEIAKNIIKNESNQGIAIIELGELIRTEIEQDKPILNSIYGAILNDALDEIDYQEVAEPIIKEIMQDD